MALFDNINSRYTQSMAEGGSYRRDAAEGGYDRKELRGLSKQAKSGSLTQRERARYNYLKKERKGRRKRGLLAGLGGAAALAGGLAAAGKLGGGSGGGGLMDSIKNRLQARTERKAEEEQFNRRDANLQQELRDDNLASAIEGSEDQETFSREGRNAETYQMNPLGEEDEIEGEESGEELGRQAAEMRAARAAERARIDADLEKNFDLWTGTSGEAPRAYDSETFERINPGTGTDTQDRSMFNEEFGEGDLYEQQTGMPVRRDGPRAKFGMKVKTQKQEKLDRLRKFMKNRYR